MNFDESVRSEQPKPKSKAKVNDHMNSEKKISPIREELKETSMDNYSEDGDSSSTEKANTNKLKNTLKHEDTDSISSNEVRHAMKPKVAGGELVIEKGRGQTTISVSGLSSSMLPKKGDVESALGTEEESEPSSLDQKENHIWAQLREKYLGIGKNESPLSSDSDD